MNEGIAKLAFERVEQMGRKLGYTTCLKEIIEYAEKQESEGKIIDREFFKVMIEEFIIKSIS